MVLVHVFSRLEALVLPRLTDCKPQDLSHLLWWVGERGGSQGLSHLLW